MYWLILGHVPEGQGSRDFFQDWKCWKVSFFLLALISHWWAPFLVLSTYLASTAHANLVFPCRPTQANLPILAGNPQKWFHHDTPVKTGIPPMWSPPKRGQPQLPVQLQVTVRSHSQLHQGLALPARLFIAVTAQPQQGERCCPPRAYLWPTWFWWPG